MSWRADQPCPDGVPPEDVVAYGLDAERGGHPDLAAHLEGCPACQAVLASAARVADASAVLRAAPAPSPQRVGDRALARVRLDVTARLLVRTVAGAFTRVARAVPDLFGNESGSRAGGPSS